VVSSYLKHYWLVVLVDIFGTANYLQHPYYVSKLSSELKRKKGNFLRQI